MADALHSRRTHRLLFLGGAIVVLAVALALRLYGRRWDAGWYMQPDERFIVLVLADRLHAPSLHHLSSLFDPARSPLNPRRLGLDGRPQSFAYGTLPLYLADLSAWLAGLVLGRDLNDYLDVGIVGRTLTACVDTATVALAMVLARGLYGRAAALIAGALLALAVIMIQQAHFFTTDAWVTCLATLTLLAAFALAHRPSRRRALLAGLVVGAGLATKVSVVTLGLPVLAAVLLGVWHLPRREGLRLGAGRLGASAAGAVAAFAIFEPYALWRPRPFFDDVLAQWRMASGRDDLPYTRQFIGRIPLRYELGNLVHWGLGPLFGLAGLLALLALARRWRRITPGEVILLAWIFPYLAVITGAQAKYLRYSEPIVPALAILTAGFLATLPRRARGRALRWSSVALVGVVLVGTLGWALTFESIYRRPNAHVAASEWIYQHVPAGATITAEWWDDSLPLPLADQPSPAARFHPLELDLYADRPSAAEFDYVSGFLRESDYIILASDRLAGSIPRVPWRYPIAAAYYRLLESGQLGFQLVYEANDEPSLGPLVFHDRAADESFTVYDHPHVRIYRKVQQLSVADLGARFASALSQPAVASRTPPPASLLLDQPVDTLPAASDLSWAAGWAGSGLLAALWWLVVVSAVGLAGLPLTLRIFERFADLGWGFARLVGLVVTGYVVWLAVSLQLIPYDEPEISLALVAVAALGWLSLRSSWRRRWTHLRASWRIIAASELVFLGSFGFFLLIRALNPDLWQTFWGGEKPMEMAFIQAVARSRQFPPYDPWYAGGIMNYYYYGFYLVSLLWKLSGIAPEVAFNLAVPTVSGLLASAVFSLAATLGRDLVRLRRAGWVIGAGLVGVVLELFIGNLDALRQLSERPGAAFDFWQSSRVVDYAITEFPYFTSIWGDLHPHAINIPLLVLLFALCFLVISQGLDRWRFGALSLVLGSVVVTNSWDMPSALLISGASVLTGVSRARGWRPRSLAAGLAAATGVSLLAYALFRPFFSHFVALVSGIARTSHGTAAGEYILHYGIFLGILVLSGGVWCWEARGRLRIWLGWRQSATGATGAALTYLGVAAATGGPAPALALLGAVLAALIGAGVGAALLAPGSLPLPGRAAQAVGVGGAIVAGALLPHRPTAALLVLPLLLGARLWLDRRSNPALSTAGLFLTAAAGITLGADLVYVVDDLSASDWERMNTVFKFYVEAWSLYALAAGLAVVWLARRALPLDLPPLGVVTRPWRPVAVSPGATRGTSRRPARAALTGCALLIACGFLYPLYGTPSRLDQRMNASPAAPTLDGLAWMRGSTLTTPAGKVIDFSGDYEAILWLRAHAPGDSVLLEASIGPYRGNGARISAGTGLPDVLGWDRHERQQRPQPGIDRRLADVRLMYTTTDVNLKLALLRQYRVRFVVVGDVERDWVLPGGQPYADPAGLAAFDRLLGSGLEVAFQSGHTTVYEVVPFPALAPAQGAGA